jgi:GDPmannose 4,6-dehydratase
MPTALVTGVSGQDGTYLAELLVAKGYRVVGTTRDAARARTCEHADALRGVDLVETDGRSLPALLDVLRQTQPGEVYHLAAPSRVSASFEDPDGAKRGILGTTAVLLEAVQQSVPGARCFVAGSCEMFRPEDHGQDESAPREPVSPYGEAKLAAFDLVRTYRSMGRLFAVTGILFSHESPRRGASFVTRKVARAAAAVARGTQREVKLGSLDVRRDWGFAGDYVRAMWAMLQEETPDDLVIGTGIAHSVGDLCFEAFAAVGRDWQDHVVSDAALVRAGDPPLRLADPSRARRRLGWSPEVDFRGLVSMMVEHEMGQGT